MGKVAIVSLKILSAFSWWLKRFLCSQVTGANKGLGYATVKGLAKEFDGIIYLTGKIGFILNLRPQIIRGNST